MWMESLKSRQIDAVRMDLSKWLQRKFLLIPRSRRSAASCYFQHYSRKLPLFWLGFLRSGGERDESYHPKYRYSTFYGSKQQPVKYFYTYEMCLTQNSQFLKEYLYNGSTTVQNDFVLISCVDLVVDSCRSIFHFNLNKA